MTGDQKPGEPGSTDGTTPVVEFADEAEAAAGGAPPVEQLADDKPPKRGREVDAYSFRGKVKRIFQIAFGLDVSQLSADPEGRTRQARAHQEIRWRNVYAGSLLIGMLGQIFFADWILWKMLGYNGYKVDTAIIIAFFTSVVVEVIGLVLVITQSLFPRPREPKDDTQAP